MKIVIAAAYKFVPLHNLTNRRLALKSLCDEAGLRGTILLASEGINFVMAGDRKGIDQLLDSVQSDAVIGPLEVKESFSDDQPFNRMLVKIKKEIIAFGVDGIAPGSKTSKKITPHELQQWLDEGRDITLLDTRNDYEIELGTFSGAERIGIDHFRHFPRAAEKLSDAWRDRPLVMFCTGGIRCEKAGPLLERLGFEQVFQLDGGILRYFEEVGQAHYEGDCFVFDKRVAIDAALEETDAELCFACQRVLSAQEQRSPQYVVGVSCPHCYSPSEDGATLANGAP